MIMCNLQLIMNDGRLEPSIFGGRVLGLLFLLKAKLSKIFGKA